MKTTTTTQTDFSNLSEGQLKAIALKLHLSEDFFILNDKVYEGTEDEAREQYEDEQHEMNENTETDFETWCSENLTEVEEYDTESYNNNYLVLTDEEADEKAKDYILDSVWAFNANFLSSETGHDTEVFQAIQSNGRCESNNKAILALIEDEDSFVESAISADGRGHFLSFYNGHENEETVNGVTYYIYRQN